MGDGVILQDVRYSSSEIASQRKWVVLTVGSGILRFYTCRQIPVPLLRGEPAAKYLLVHYILLTTCVHV